MTRNMVRESGGLDVLVKIINDANNRKIKPLMAAATGAVWKTAKSPENVERFDSLRAVEVNYQYEGDRGNFIFLYSFRF